MTRNQTPEVLRVAAMRPPRSVKPGFRVARAIAVAWAPSRSAESCSQKLVTQKAYVPAKACSKVAESSASPATTSTPRLASA